MRNASLQFVRKISGATKPSKANEHAFNHAVDEVTEACQKLLASMVTTAPPKNRQEFEEKAKEKSRRRFGGEAGSAS